MRPPLQARPSALLRAGDRATDPTTQGACQRRAIKAARASRRAVGQSVHFAGRLSNDQMCSIGASWFDARHTVSIIRHAHEHHVSAGVADHMRIFDLPPALLANGKRVREPAINSNVRARVWDCRFPGFHVVLSAAPSSNAVAALKGGYNRRSGCKELRSWTRSALQSRLGHLGTSFKGAAETHWRALAGLCAVLASWVVGQFDGDGIVRSTFA
jgi:hypothetical protein